MGWFILKDVIYVENNYSVSVRGHSFRFYDFINKSEKFIPYDEVGVIIFDGGKSYFSNTFVQKCLIEDINIIFCDAKHSPFGYINSDFIHRNRLSRLQLQMNVSQKVKDRLWKKIVGGKIKNQSTCLEYYKEDIDSARKVLQLGKEVSEGDKTNKEAVAAKRYFMAMFGESFRRGRYDDIINASLNYGYAIIRSSIRKELSILGFEQSLGIHHRSTENPYNLSDDLIEPFRPFVDMLVLEYITNQGVTELQLIHKQQLVKVLFENCIIDNKIYHLADAIKITCESYLKCLEESASGLLKLPCFLEVGR